MNKEIFKNEAKKNIDNIFAKMDELEAKKGQVKAEVKAEYEKSLAKLRAEKGELKAMYHKLADLGEDKWEESKKALTSASDSFKEGITKINSLIS